MSSGGVWYCSGARSVGQFLYGRVRGSGRRAFNAALKNSAWALSKHIPVRSDGAADAEFLGRGGEGPTGVLRDLDDRVVRLLRIGELESGVSAGACPVRHFAI